MQRALKGYVGKLPVIRAAGVARQAEAAARRDAGVSTLDDIRMELVALQAEVRSLRKQLFGNEAARAKLRYRVGVLEEKCGLAAPGAAALLAKPDAAVLAALLDSIAQRSGIAVEDLTSRRVFRPWMPARAVFCVLARRRGFTLGAVGNFLGGRDHTSALYLANKGAAIIAADPAQWGDLDV